MLFQTTLSNGWARHSSVTAAAIFLISIPEPASGVELFTMLSYPDGTL